MEKIEVGEYVRSKEGLIIKVDWVGQYIVTDKEDKITISKQDIVKHSLNIIDIIEEGDYVNGYKVDFVQNNEIIYNHNHPYKINMFAKDIKSIVTKESYKNIEYRLEEK